ncbi:hypothetical protein OS493_008666 [Desmophyllum pertusum]|uniref:Uncharacterized protein n=1 Tax=Desmophyllum pertusum TaxID=174260 RepID=A0A9W9ZS59_9CNID|nr:hypothetical protein OS493_008666 [Desmophyllum pertusum]
MVEPDFDGLRLDTITHFLDAIEPRPLDKEPVRGNLKWLTIKTGDQCLIQPRLRRCVVDALKQYLRNSEGG